MTDRRACVALLVLLSACSAPKPPSAFERDFDDETKSWQEVQTQLPAAPNDANLVAFAVSGGTQYRFAVDAPSLSIGTDGVFRYVLVATSAQGSRNVSYEGIRCQTREKKLYATGRTDGTWVRSRSAAWMPVDDVSINRQHAALMKEYFCPEGYPAQNVGEIVARMRMKQPQTNFN